MPKSARRVPIPILVVRLPPAYLIEVPPHVVVKLTPRAGLMLTRAETFDLVDKLLIAVRGDRPSTKRRKAPMIPHDLDPHIQNVVTWLASHNFQTTDSGDGVTKPAAGDTEALREPHVFMKVLPAKMISESHRLLALLGTDLHDRARVEATYSPIDGVATLALWGVDDSAIAILL